jgi:hypothetical protein
MNILECMNDKALFAPIFRRRWLGLGADSWRAWKSFLATLFGLPLEGEALDLFRRHTGRQDAPAKQFGEGYCIVGRRGGKSILSAFIATYLSVFRDYREYLAPGEKPIAMLLAQDRQQAAILLRYIGGFFDSIPVLRRMVKARLRESIELTNGVSLQVHTSSYKSVRGYSCICCIADELAFWQDDSGSNPASEVLAAVKPSLATIPGSLLLGISSPYSQRGLLFEQYRAHYGKNDSSTLIWKAASEEMNPTLDKRVVASAYASDPASASAEYGGCFRSDVETFLSLELVENCTVAGRLELLPEAGRDYRAFVDPSGGSSDSMTLGISHATGDRVILDRLVERVPPFDPQSVCMEFAAVLRSYHLSEVCGDRYGGEWVSSAFEKLGVRYTPSERDRSAIYGECLPLFSARRCELLDNAKLKMQLVSLERKTGRGKDIIDHPPSGHDDLSNAACGALVLSASEGGVLGLIGYLQGISEGKYDMESKATFAPAITTKAPTPPPPEEKPSCPVCHSAQFVIRAASGFHCNKCQRGFFRDGQGPMILRAGFKFGKPSIYEERMR